MARREAASIYTVGYQGLTIEQFIRKLEQNKIQVLVDVRSNPISRKPGFSKKRLRKTSEAHGIKYRHLPELGIPSEYRKSLDAKKPETYRILFAFYEDSIVPAADEAMITIKQLASDNGRIALTCFEADHAFCHRSRLAEVIERDKKFENHVHHI